MVAGLSLWITPGHLPGHPYGVSLILPVDNSKARTFDIDPVDNLSAQNVGGRRYA